MESELLELVHPLLSANYHLQLKLMYCIWTRSGPLSLGMGREGRSRNRDPCERREPRTDDMIYFGNMPVGH